MGTGHIVLYGAGSSVLVDAEETCIRSGLEIAAIVHNYVESTFAIHIEKFSALPELTLELLKYSVTMPLFTPGHRKFALDQAIALGTKRFDPLIDPTAILPSSLEISEAIYINCGVTIGRRTIIGTSTVRLIP